MKSYSYFRGGNSILPNFLFFLSMLAVSVFSGQYPVYLTANWKLQPVASVAADAALVSTVGFNMAAWIPATVPGTVLTSYVDQKLVPEPIYQNNMVLIDSATQQQQFWYRTEFTVPAGYAGQRILINFNGINWKADIWVNGHFKGKLSYAFMRGTYDITDDVTPGATACLAVLIYPCAHPGPGPSSNGGALGYDCPTFTASQHWNWIPTVKGRDIGIWDNVYLTAVNPVMIQYPLFRSYLPVPDTTKADLFMQATLRNFSGANVAGTLQMSLGSITVSQTCMVPANGTATVAFDTINFPQLKMSNPHLWWPNGYGAQYLYDWKMQFSAGGNLSDSQTVKVGVRQLSYNPGQDWFHVSCNGERLVLLGGNWGMPEFMLRCPPAKYDQWVRMHKEMNFNMIRNWVGQTGHDAFYESCDKYGILIFDDFWLANPGDGPDPDSIPAFARCARDKVARQRNHPSVCLWVGRNEGAPPTELNDSLRNICNKLDSTRYYTSNSAGYPLSGNGPYEQKDPKWYFANRGTGTLHSEVGVVAPMVYESMIEALGPNCWPITMYGLWGFHNFSQVRCDTMQMQVRTRYGAATSLADFCKKAQVVEFQEVQAELEPYQAGRGSGVLLWMSHPAWTSLICQVYDYFGDYTGGFFGAKKASERIHILWNCYTNAIVVANNTKSPLTNVTATACIYNKDGSRQDTQTVTLTVGKDTSATAFPLTFPAAGLSDVHFIRLKLFAANRTKLLSENFYWRGNTDLDYTGLNTLAPASLTWSNVSDTGATLNNGNSTAFFIRLKVVDAQGNRILPVYYSDNYFTLLPGESKNIRVESPAPGTLVAEPYNGGGPTASQMRQLTATVSLSIFPNPSHCSVRVNISNARGLEQMGIYDVRGKLLEKYAGKPREGSLAWQVKSLPQGISIVRATISGRQYAHKIVLER